MFIIANCHLINILCLLFFRNEMGQICTPVFIFTIIFLLNSGQCQKQCRARSNQLNSLFKTLLSPANLESIKQKKIAAASKNYPYANTALANEYYSNVSPNVVPVNVLPNAYMPANVLPSGVTPANLLQNAFIPANMLSNAYMPALPTVPICQTEVKPRLVEAVDVPKRVCANPVQVTPPLVIKEQPVLPASLVNPYLPAASPVSALAPTTSNLLPPADFKNCRCNYLRKIPIPPPTI